MVALKAQVLWFESKAKTTKVPFIAQTNKHASKVTLKIRTCSEGKSKIHHYHVYDITARNSETVTTLLMAQKN